VAEHIAKRRDERERWPEPALRRLRRAVRAAIDLLRG
jgi:hypothetical protein